MEPILKPGEWLDNMGDPDLDGWQEMLDALLAKKRTEGDDLECI